MSPITACATRPACWRFAYKLCINTINNFLVPYGAFATKLDRSVCVGGPGPSSVSKCQQPPRICLFQKLTDSFHSSDACSNGMLPLRAEPPLPTTHCCCESSGGLVSCPRPTQALESQRALHELDLGLLASFALQKLRVGYKDQAGSRSNALAQRGNAPHPPCS